MKILLIVGIVAVFAAIFYISYLTVKRDVKKRRYWYHYAEDITKDAVDTVSKHFPQLVAEATHEEKTKKKA